jgi:type II secretory pathway component PulF
MNESGDDQLADKDQAFDYLVKDATGQIRSGRSWAQDADTLRRRLIEQGFKVVEVKPARELDSTSTMTIVLVAFVAIMGLVIYFTVSSWKW